MGKRKEFIKKHKNMGNPIHHELEEIREELDKENIKVSSKSLKIIYIIIVVILFLLFFLGIF